MAEEVDVKPIRTKETNTKADAVLSMFDTIAEDVLASVTAKIDRRVSQRVKKLEDAVNLARPIYVKSPNFESKPITGIQHHNFENLVHIVNAAQPVMLVGPAGTGKSHAAEQVAEVLGLTFYAMSVGAQTSKSDLIGYMDAMKNYVSTPFRKAYEHGGLFLLDEIDAGNSNVLIQLNAALANGYMSFPDEMIRRNENFRFVASANTFGLGANRQYVGRNQLDAATLDRFATLQWDIDNRVEETLAIGHFGPSWMGVVRMVREYVEARDLRVVISPRATQRGAKLLAANLGFNDVLHIALLSQFGAEEKQDLHVKCHTVWREAIASLPDAEDAEPVVKLDKPIVAESPVVEETEPPQPEFGQSLNYRVNSAAKMAYIDDAYTTLLGDEIFEAQVPQDNVDTCNSIFSIMDDKTKWDVLHTIAGCSKEERTTDMLKVALAQKLRRDQWDFRGYAEKSVTV